MKNKKLYQDYQEGDFLCDEYFQDWVIRPDEEKNNFWESWLKDNPSKAPVVAQAKALLSGISFVEHMPSKSQIESSLTKSLAAIPVQERSYKRPGIVRKINTAWKVAAMLILVTSVGAYFYFDKMSERQIATTNTARKSKNDIAPGGNKAILTLSDGSAIVLDSASKGTLAQQGSTKILKLDDGKLSYEATAGSSEVLYNTISTPRGGQYQLELPDGSKVWLNAASSLRFPTAFSGNERNVELTGEGYFEIAKNANKPFHVMVNDMTVEVLGTHFNVNAYDDEETVKTTLLEGLVKINAATASNELKPGQQAQVDKKKNIKVVNADVDEAVAWKNGFFTFSNADLPTVLRQLSRWYDVQITYEGAIPQRQFKGEMQRDLNLSEVLKILETNNVHFKIVDKRLMVTQ